MRLPDWDSGFIANVKVAKVTPRTKTYSANRGGRIVQVSSGQFIKVTPKVNNKLKDTQQ